MSITPFSLEADADFGYANVREPHHLPTLPMQDSAVRITAIETTVPPAYGMHLMMIRVHTDAGIIGHGEIYYASHVLQALIHRWMSERLLSIDSLAEVFSKTDNIETLVNFRQQRCMTISVSEMLLSRADLARLEVN